MAAKIIIQPASIKVLVDKSWDFSYRALWKKCLLNERETEIIKELINNYYWSIPPSEFTQKAQIYFRSFIIRVMEMKRNKSFKLYLPLKCSVAEKILLHAEIDAASKRPLESIIM